MKLYIEAKTNIKDLVIEYIEVILNDGRRISLNLGESETARTEEGFEARYLDVCFGEEYANGCITQLDPIHIADIGIYTTNDGFEDIELNIQHMQFVDSLINGSEKVLDLYDVLQTENLQLTNETFGRIEDFVKDWLYIHPQYIDELGNENDVVDDKFIYDIGYGMKEDATNAANPLGNDYKNENEECNQTDDWYDSLMHNTIVPILKSIRYNLMQGRKID